MGGRVVALPGEGRGGCVSARCLSTGGRASACAWAWPGAWAARPRSTGLLHPDSCHHSPRTVGALPQSSWNDHNWVTDRIALGSAVSERAQVEILVRVGVSHVLDCRLLPAEAAIYHG